MHSLVLLAWFLACALQDLRERQVANLLTLGACTLALGYLLWSGHTWLGAPAVEGGWAFALSLAFTLPGYALGRLGAGDVKLLAALGIATSIDYLLGTFIGAGLSSLLWFLLAPKLWPHIAQRLKAHLHQIAPNTSKKHPFVPFLFVGFFATWLCFH